jgi:hypothetical protein
VRHLALIAAFSLVALCACRARADEPQSGYTAAGLYNLANSYALAGEPGMAVLNYRRAQLLAPNDPDIDANLRRVLLTSHIASQPRRWFEPVVGIASPTALSWVGVAGLILTGTCLITGQLFSRYRSLRRAGSLIGLLLILVTIGSAVSTWPVLHAAVVITAETPVRVSPVPLGDPAFVLPEAETVTIQAEHEGFVLIRTAAGRVGWVAHANVAPIVPSRTQD